MTLGKRRGTARILRGGWTPRLVVVEPARVPARLPRGTVEFSPRESLGRGWFYSLQLEWLGQNLAVAGACELAYRLGRAARDIEALGTRGCGK